MNNIIQYPDPRLRKISENFMKEELESDYFQNLIDEMIDFIKKDRGMGLAACQIGVNKNLFVCKIKSEIITFVNAKVLARSGKYWNRQEGCLSVPDVRKDVKRSKMIKLQYLTRNGKEELVKAEKLNAAVIQHELDHTNGILIIDK